MQNYNNHVRINKIHSIVFAPIVLVLMIVSFIKLIISTKIGTAEMTLWAIIFMVLFLLLWFSAMTRVNYSLVLQNRIILLEENFRYYRLTGKTFEEADINLQDKQIIALRFASDEEFIMLVQKSQAENLDSNTIKKEIKSWRADYRRV